MRKLAIIAGAFSFAVIAAVYLPERTAALFCGASLLAVLCVLLLHKSRKTLVIAGIFFICLGLVVFSVNDLIIENKASRVSNEETSFQALVLDYPTVSGKGSRLKIKILNGPAKGLKAYLYDYKHDLSTVEPGMVIETDCVCTYVGTEKEDNYDSMLSSGFFLKGNVSSDITVLSLSRINPDIFAAKTRQYVKQLISDAFPDRAVAFYESLLIGDKTELYQTDSQYSLLSRAGIVHIVAVSGMHVAFIAGFLQLFFGKRRLGAFACIILIWIFVAVTGNSPSAVRAGIMQTVLLIGRVVRRENDPVTSLMFALAIILFINPYSAKSISLQLSFGATFGICVLGRDIKNCLTIRSESKLLSKILDYPADIFSNTAAVLFVTIPISYLYFDSISTVAPITSLLCMWVIPICFCGGLISCGLYILIPPMGSFLADALSYLSDFIFSVCRLTSSLSCASVYTEKTFSLVFLICVYVVCILFAFSSFKPKQKLILSVASSAALAAAFFTFSFIQDSVYDCVCTVVDVGQGQCVTVTDGKRTAVIDCGSADYNIDAGQSASEYLKSCGHSCVDILVFTHLHEDHANGALSLIDSIDVASVVLPRSEEEQGTLYDLILQKASQKHIPVYIVRDTCSIRSGNLMLSLFPSTSSVSDLNEDCMCAVVDVSEFRVAITGDSPLSRETELIDNDYFHDVDLLIAGHHGSSSSSGNDFLNYVSPGYTAISVGYGNYYGHPSSAALQRISCVDTELFRTDLNGNIVFSYKE